jgi:flagellar basal-body rod protein FlgF
VLALLSSGSIYLGEEMSAKGIYTAVSGAMAQAEKLDTIANNLANVNTPAFKKDQQVFQEYLTAYEKEQGVIEVPRVPASIESFYDIQGGDKSYVDSAGTFTNHEQGALKKTDNSFDLALEGKGFFEVLTPQGIRMTRNGTFLMDNQGRLVTKEGHFVLGEGNGPIQSRLIQLGATGRVDVSASGQVLQNGAAVGTLSVVEPDNLDALKKEGSSLFTIKENMAPVMKPSAQFKIHQGFIEASNVNVVKEMSDMIQTTRLFETTQKAIQAYDHMDQKLVNDVPKF